MKSQSVRTKCVSESKQKEKRKIERARENCERKYTMRKEAVSEKKKRVFLYSSCISKYCNLYLI